MPARLRYVKLKMPRKKTPTLPYVGYILALAGGIIIIVLGLFELFELGVRVFQSISLLSFFSGTAGALVQIVIGIICAIGSRFVSKLVWAIVLLLLGIVAGTIGGTLVAFGAILGLVVILVKSAAK